MMVPVRRTSDSSITRRDRNITMLTATTKKRMAFAVALTATLGAATLPGGDAKADPQQYSAYVGVGSDTIQDVVNAFAGTTNNSYYQPIKSTNGTQIISFDASIPAGVADSCVTTKLGGPTFTRPNGSTGGRKALYASSGLSAAGWTGVAINGVATCATAVDISGQIDFARSSAGPSAGDLGTDLTYVPFARDGVSFAYYRNAGSPVTSLTRAQLTSLFTTGPQTISGVRIVPCGIQTSSGTFGFWNTVTTASSGQENAATAECNALIAAGRSQENDGAGLVARGNALAAITTASIAATTVTQGVAASAGPPVVVAVNEVQRIVPLYGPTGGTFTLTFGANTTATLQASDTAATVQTALQGLASIGAGNVTVTGGPLTSGALTLTFGGTLAGTNVAQVTASASFTGASHAGDQVVIGFSAGSWISQANGAANNTLSSALMGSITDNGSGTNLGNPVTGASAPNYGASSSFYADAIFGRNVYIVMPTSVATGGGNAQIKSLFVSSTNSANDAKICLETATITKFGFLPVPANCGSTALKGTWITGAS